MAIAQLLEDAGYHALTASDGLEALEILRREPRLRPSLVLLDVMMPNFDASELVDAVARCARASPDRRAVPA